MGDWAFYDVKNDRLTKIKGYALRITINFTLRVNWKFKEKQKTPSS